MVDKIYVCMFIKRICKRIGPVWVSSVLLSPIVIVTDAAAAAVDNHHYLLLLLLWLLLSFVDSFIVVSVCYAIYVRVLV